MSEPLWLARTSPAHRRLRTQGSTRVKPSHPLHQLRNSHREPFGEPTDVDQARLTVTILEGAHVLPAEPRSLAELFLREGAF